MAEWPKAERRPKVAGGRDRMADGPTAETPVRSSARTGRKVSVPAMVLATNVQVPATVPATRMGPELGPVTVAATRIAWPEHLYPRARILAKYSGGSSPQNNSRGPFEYQFLVKDIPSVLTTH